MQSRLIRTNLGQYEAVQFKGTNESGFTPIGDRVIVMPDQVPATTAGGITLPDDTRERQALAAETGTLIASGPEAFKKMSDDARPKPGTRVFFDRYSGGTLHGEDGLLYRCMDDKCIGAIST